jgi:hypothetical protein
MNVSTFNKLFGTPESKSLIQKAFSSASNIGGALVPEHLEEVITNTLVRLVPELAIPVLKFDNQKFHEFNRLISLPGPGSAMGENSVTPTRNSSVERASVELKVLKRKGAVTGFLQDAAANYMDAQAFEMETHLQSFGNDMRTYILYGNKAADQYTFDGLDTFIATYRKNTVAAGAVPGSLSILDDIIDHNMRKNGSSHRRVFEMSPEMLSVFSRLYTQVRDNREAIRGTSVVEVDGGWRLQTYRDIPIVETTATRPVKQTGTVSIGTATTGGTIAADDYFFKVAAVTWDGEQRAAEEVSQITTGATSTITLTLTEDADAMFYKVYVSDATNTEVLRTIVAGYTYDADGTKTGNTTSIVFTTNPSTADASVPVHMQLDIPLGGTASNPMEVIFFWDLDEFQGMGKLAFTNSAGSRYEGLATVKPLAETDDFVPFMIKSYPALIDSFEATCGLIRGYKTA